MSATRHVRSAPRVLSYPAARIVAVFATAGGVFMINWSVVKLLGAALTRDILRLEHARCWLAVGLASTAFFAGHQAIGFRTFLVVRMLGCGLFSGLVALGVAAWTLNARRKV